MAFGPPPNQPNLEDPDTLRFVNRTHLGKQSVIETDPSKVVLDLIENPQLSTMYVCRFSIPEYTSKCPVTGQPDFAHLIIDYVPSRHLVESKALKLYMFAFRDHGAFHEDVTITIGKRLYSEMKPLWLLIAGFWNGRGGIAIDVVWEGGILPSGAHPLDINNMKHYSNGHW